MPKGKLKIRERENGSLTRFIQISSSKQVSIPLHFKLEKELNNQECEYEIDKSGIITSIVVNGKAIPIDDTLAQMRTEARQKKQEEEKERNKQAELERKQSQNQSQQNQSSTPQPKEVFDINQLSKLPKDTRALLTKDTIDEIDNLSLRVMKGVNFWEGNKNKATLYQVNKPNRKKGTGEETMRHLPKGAFNYGHFPFAAFAKEKLNTAQELYPNLVEQKYQTVNRLITGIGGASVFEVGFTLHHVYGFPYIPASSIKGITRSWMINSKYEGSETLALQDRAFCDLFGCPGEWKDKENVVQKSWYAANKQFPSDNGDRVGNIVFFDAFPTAIPKVEEDIMNVHYPDYYQGKSGPNDSQNPNPIVFLAVAVGTPFQFLVATRNRVLNQSLVASDLLNIASEAMHQALTEHGIGAKTAVGYGYMEKV